MASKTSANAEGSRWINQRPTSEEVAAWFVKNAPVADELDASRYVTGVTLIPAKEKPKTVKNGTVMDGPEQLVFTPYVKVETRVAYFWDLMRAHSNEWVGVIEAEPMRQFHEAGFTNDNLPAGAFRMPVKKADGKTVDFIGFSYHVAVYEKGSIEKVRIRSDALPGWRAAQMGQEDQFRIVGVPVMKAPAGSKVVPLLTKWGEDPFALMKAQTGAIGRALGMAGMLVIPGSGVATAEDVQEAQDQGAAGAIDASLEGDVQRGVAAAATSTKEYAEQLIARLQSEHPDRLEKVQAWAEERKIRLTELTDESPALRGVVRQLERSLAEGDDA